MIKPLKINKDYWETFQVTDEDFNFLNNHLLDIEIPQSSQELLSAVITNRIQSEKDTLTSKTESSGSIYIPKGEYKKGDKLVFSAFNWEKGTVINVRDGFNPEFNIFKVIQIEMENGDKHEFASNLENHILSTPIDLISDDPNFDKDFVLKNFSEDLAITLEKSLEKNKGLVRIAGAWFPRALLVDINAGHLNLAEAVLEEVNGGPMKTRDLIEQIELKSDTNENLTEFSFNLALQDDKRFDEVGPAGEVLWFLKALEPQDVQEQPLMLEYSPIDYDHKKVGALLSQFEGDVFDELETWDEKVELKDEIIVSLIYPHWQTGTLPLSKSLSRLFPTAYEAPRVRFTFVEKDGKSKFNGWVVREQKYVYGLRAWYQENGLIPGSLVKVKTGKKPGEIIVEHIKSRQTKEWLKTVLIGSDKGIVFAMLKQSINVAFNERMAIAIPDPQALQQLWTDDKKQVPLENIILRTMRELAKLNPQGHIHAQEIYAAVNITRRCPPGIIIYFLINNHEIAHSGDLYFHFKEREN